MDRPVFLRETLNKSYNVSAFFIAKNACELIFQIIYPSILIIIIFFGTDLNKNGAHNFWIFCKISSFSKFSYNFIFYRANTNMWVFCWMFVWTINISFRSKSRNGYGTFPSFGGAFDVIRWVSCQSI